MIIKEIVKRKNHKNVIHSLKDVCVCVYVLFFCCPSGLGRLGAILCET